MASQDPTKLVSVNQDGKSIDPEYPPDQAEVNRDHPTEEKSERVEPKLGDAKVDDLDYPESKRS
jgi:hypothetical protein